MNKSWHWLFFSLILLSFTGGWIWFSRSSAADTTAGKIPAPHPGFLAPNFSLLNMTGETVTLAEFRGRPVVINYWASWCGPCRSEMPAIEKVSQEYSQDELIILGVNGTNQDDLGNVSEFIQEFNLSFPILFDVAGEVAQLYRIQSLPTTYFVDKDGVIKDLVIGGMSESLLRLNIKNLLDENEKVTD